MKKYVSVIANQTKEIIIKATTLLVALLVVSSFGDIQAQKKGQKYHTKNKKAITLYEDALNDYQFEKLQSAKLKFEKVLKMDPDFVEANFMMSEVCRDMGDYENQVVYIDKGITLDSTYYVSAYYQAGVALCKLDRFTEATQWFELYKKYSAGKKNVKNVDAMLAKAQAVQDLMANPVPFKPRLLSENIVMDYDQYWPSVTLDDEEIVFTVLKPRNTKDYSRKSGLIKNSNNFHEDFYFSKKVDGEWTKPEPLKAINTNANEGAQTISADGQWMFFTACGREDSYGSCDIYFCRKTATGWSKPKNIGQPVNTPYWESQPCFSADGQTLYFVSNRPGGKGSLDIWMASIIKMDTGGMPIFGNLKNLGDSINTRGTETSPFIHPDNKTLYFSSDGLAGVGELDIYVSRKNKEGEWGTPVNIGYPINTPRDDDGLRLNADGTMAYMASEIEQPDGTYKRDILCFDMPLAARPEPVSYIKGHVYDEVTLEPLKANLELIRLDNGEKQVNTTSSEATGTFIVNLPTGKDYGLFASCNGYLYKSMNFALKETAATSDKVTLDIPMSKVAKGQTITLRNVFFDTNSTELKEESQIELNRLVSLLKNSPKTKVEIGGHTDNIGTAEYNQKLSEGRAKTTVDYLVKHGIAPQRISYKGYGLTKPLMTNDTEEGRAQNRRIEAKIIE